MSLTASNGNGVIVGGTWPNVHVPVEKGVRDELKETLDRLRQQVAAKTKEMESARARYKALEEDRDLLARACDHLQIALEPLPERHEVMT